MEVACSAKGAIFATDATIVKNVMGVLNARIVFGARDRIPVPTAPIATTASIPSTWTSAKAAQIVLIVLDAWA